MEPHAFVAEVYRRMSASQLSPRRETWQKMELDPAAEEAAHHYALDLLITREGATEGHERRFLRARRAECEGMSQFTAGQDEP
jgi:hypothetical protein